ncbi:MAG: molybdate ABC transporter substrate-binding protein [Pseudomonadota bacterium]
MADLSAAFTAETGYELDIVAGSTGKLYFQIARGAAIDAFLAADVDRPDRLIEDGLAAPESQFTYAIGRLVLWYPSGDDVCPDRLQAPVSGWLAIAYPDLAPYGRAA